ncbi:hypothetical protein M5362_24545 [Streptomyces sp. Je 1-79]|uniref:hypothetical protein n=1 Tax=Streptomyces sp. Je 1-79 TaxID=2943847 RepID=UPI0021A41AAC|nr:hypothetical protein [Streptomyces sp. Je 1-79]MCT4356301.1 hypothetical protein [Streptomyces sp. Je 1-79]
MGLWLGYGFIFLVQCAVLLAQFGGAALSVLGTAWLGRRAWAARGGDRLDLPPVAFALFGAGVFLLTAALLTRSAGERLGLDL